MDWGFPERALSRPSLKAIANTESHRAVNSESIQEQGKQQAGSRLNCKVVLKLAKFEFWPHSFPVWVLEVYSFLFKKEMDGVLRSDPLTPIMAPSELGTCPLGIN